MKTSTGAGVAAPAVAFSHVPEVVVADTVMGISGGSTATIVSQIKLNANVTLRPIVSA